MTENATVESRESAENESKTNLQAESPSNAAETRHTSRNWFNFAGSWGWEIGSAALSVAALVLLMLFLTYLQGTAYASWAYRISPNAVISIMVIVGKAAVLAFDQASRGIFGSLEMLWGVTPSIATAGAIIVILSIAIDPFAQQLLMFPPSSRCGAK
ncbi:hypothetical protein VTN00DRAFT_7551 [Thermoascus crustaceus]|uniref:uncharacterized protein n=1 Tax=Thermoascus crustaceus TaxID=5088 RepID=UPI003742E606